MRSLLLLFLALPCFAQGDLPERGTLADIQGKTKVYIVADGDAYKAIEKAVSGKLEVVKKPADAGFVLAYKTLSRTTIPPSGMTLETGQLDVYILRENVKIVAWSNTKTGGGFQGDTAKQLAKRFIKDFTKPPPR